MTKLFRLSITLSFIFFLISGFAYSQSLKEKMKAKLAKKENTAMYECGYVHKLSFKEKANPMKAMQKAMGNSFTDKNNKDLGNAAISVFYQAHLHPQPIMRFPTKIPGWETCGDAVFASFTNREGMGLSSTDGKILMDGEEILDSGMGTYFQGFKPEKRGEKNMVITSSDGDKIELSIKPGAPLKIISINGNSNIKNFLIDGSEDIVIILENGNADPNSKLYVQLVGKIMGTPILFDVLVTSAKNEIHIPKEAFIHYEGSPTPFAKENLLIINRVTETLLRNTDAGAIRTISAYMDWVPVTIGGILSKGNVLTMGFDTTKNKVINVDLTSIGKYNFVVSKGNPYNSPPSNKIKKVALASFIVRGNLIAEETTTKVNGDWVTTTITKKWFPELGDDTWRKLADKLYDEVSGKLTNEIGWEIVPLADIVNTEAYKHAKFIDDRASTTFVEVGAKNSKRILTTSGKDFFKDLKISFASDFISERLINETGVDAVIAINIDFNFNFTTESLDPVVRIVAFAPNVSYKTGAQYFTMSANTKAKSLKDSRKYTGGVENVIYQMIKGDIFVDEFITAINKLLDNENKNPVYELLWKAKL